MDSIYIRTYNMYYQTELMYFATSTAIECWPIFTPIKTALKSNNAGIESDH